MILVIGGLNGFIGSNTTEALVDIGEYCVVTRHKNTEVPSFLKKHIGERLFVEEADATKVEDLRRLAERHKIDGIVNVGGFFKSEGPAPGLQGYLDMLSATFRMAHEWKLKRIVMSSTGGCTLDFRAL